MKGLQAAATVLQMLFIHSPADLRFTRVKLLLAIRTFLFKVALQINCTSIGKYEEEDKCYDELGCNVMTNLVVTIRLMAVTTKFMVTAVTIDLVVSAYF